MTTTARPDAPVTEEHCKWAAETALLVLSPQPITAIAVMLAQRLANALRDARLDELIWATGATLSEKDAAAFQRRIAVLSAPAEPAKEDR